MTYAMWGILVGMTMIFAVSLYWYRQGFVRRQEIRWLSEHHVIDRLRSKLRL
jgi:hypothetical protein